MSKCLIAREVRISLRRRNYPAEEFTVICPAKWSKSTFLEYVRGEHPGEAVKIVEWKPTGTTERSWDVRLWLANPKGFADYDRGVRETASV